MGASILVSDTIHQKDQETYCHAGWEDELSKALSVRGRFKWQPNFKSGSLRTCVEVDFAVMPFDDDPAADNEPKARSQPTLRCKEGSASAKDCAQRSSSSGVLDMNSAHTVRSICSPAVSAFLRHEMLSSLSAPSVFIGVIEAFASDFRNCVDYLAALIALFSARNQANPPPGFLVTGKAKRGCPGSVQEE
jgi:hypothetical protein